MKVPRIVTAADKKSFAEAFDEAWVYTQGTTSIITPCLLFAQYAFETGWGKACFNDNLGNVRAFQEWIASGRDYFELPSAWEIVGGKRIVTGGNFRAFASLHDGMVEHLAFLQGLSFYRKAWEVLTRSAFVPATKENIESLAREFVHELKRGGYFTGSEDDYSRGVASIASSSVDAMLVARHESQPDTLREPATVLGPSEEFAGWGATTVADIFGRWEYDPQMTVDFLACRYDCDYSEVT